MMLALISAVVTALPMCVGIIDALIDPATSLTAYRARWRMFRLCGASRPRTAVWLLGGVR